MAPACDSSQTNGLLRRAGANDPQALADLFTRHCERLRKMVRLRLDWRLRGRFSSSSILDQVSLDAGRRIQEYRHGTTQSYFLWLRALLGERLAEIHHQHLGMLKSEPGQEFHLRHGALPEVNAASMAAQLMGDRDANQVALRADLLLQLQEALNGLNPLDREILALRNFEELTGEEAATVLGLAPATATLRYLQALKRLNEILRSIPGFLTMRRT